MTTTTTSLIASRFSIRRVEPKDAPLGALVLFQPPAMAREFGIVADSVEDNLPPVRGIVWLGAEYEFVPINQVNTAAVLEAWQIVPEPQGAEYRTPKPGDLMASTQGLGIVFATHSPRSRGFGLLSLADGIATIRADREALVMPWRIVSGDDQIWPA
jgi:hypothetical protein